MMRRSSRCRGSSAGWASRCTSSSRPSTRCPRRTGAAAAGGRGLPGGARRGPGQAAAGPDRAVHAGVRSDRRRERLPAGGEAPRREARPGGHGRRRARAGRDPGRAPAGRPRGPRRRRARAAGGRAPSDQRASAGGHDSLAEVGARGVRTRPRRGDVEGQARDRWLRGRPRAADHSRRDRLHGPLRGRRRVPDPPPPQQSRVDPPDGRGRPGARAALAPHHAPPDGLSGANDPPRAMTDRLQAPAFPAEVERQLEGASPCEIALGVLTYNNATTVPTVVEVVRTGLERHFAGIPAVLINADAGSSDATPGLLAAGRLPLARARHETPLSQCISETFHDVTRRRARLRLTFALARRLGARALVLLEADVTSAGAEWLRHPLPPAP